MDKAKLTSKRLRNRLTQKIWFIWGRLTASQRALPNFIIIGAQKAGTTSLHRYLKNHPQVKPALKKEVEYFNLNYGKGSLWYRAYFPRTLRLNHNFITGEASPNYMIHPLAAKRMSQDIPDVKLIVLLRNPVDRAYSHYHHSYRNRLEDLPFGEAVEMETKRLEGVAELIKAGDDSLIQTHRNHSYLTRGIYGDQLEEWFNYFSRDQVLILKSEELFKDPAKPYRQVTRFLDLPDWESDEYKNINPGSYSGMNSKMRKKLQSFFRPHNQRLFDLIDMDFGWDR